MQQTYTGSGRTRVKVGGRVKKTRYLSDGDVFRIHTSDHGINKLPGALSFLIGKGQTKSRIKFQVNCKRDIRVGDVFGVLEVVGFSTSRDSCETEQIASLGSTSADTSSSSGSSSSGGASAGLIAGIVVAALAVVVVGSVIAYHYTKAAPNPSTANANVQYNDNDENILARTKTGEEENGN